jgi:hypothetical protein
VSRARSSVYFSKKRLQTASMNRMNKLTPAITHLGRSSKFFSSQSMACFSLTPDAPNYVCPTAGHKNRCGNHTWG